MDFSKQSVLENKQIDLTAEEFLQPLDTLQLADYIQGCQSKHASSLKRPTVFCMLSAASVGVQAYALWSTNTKKDSKYSIMLTNRFSFTIFVCTIIFLSFESCIENFHELSFHSHRTSNFGLGRKNFLPHDHS